MKNEKEIKDLEELRDIFRKDGLVEEAVLIQNILLRMEFMEDEISKLKGIKKAEKD